MEIIKILNKIVAFPFLATLWAYQHTLSPDHGPLRFLFPYGYCKYYPSCSAYAITVLKKHGLKGLPKIIKRVSACTPGSLGGVDLPN